MSDSGISWATCKSAPRSRQITTPASHQSVFCALPATQPTVSMQWRNQNPNPLKQVINYNHQSLLRTTQADIHLSHIVLESSPVRHKITQHRGTGFCPDNSCFGRALLSSGARCRLAWLTCSHGRHELLRFIKHRTIQIWPEKHCHTTTTTPHPPLQVLRKDSSGW